MRKEKCKDRQVLTDKIHKMRIQKLDIVIHIKIILKIVLLEWRTLTKIVLIISHNRKSIQVI